MCGRWTDCEPCVNYKSPKKTIQSRIGESMKEDANLGN